MDAYRSTVPKPSSKVPLLERQLLARIYARGTFALLLHYAALNHDSGLCTLAELHWRMFEKYVNGLLHMAKYNKTVCAVMVRAAIQDFGLTDSLGRESQSVAGWTTEAFIDLMAFEDEDHTEEKHSDLDYDLDLDDLWTST
jgi:hypothetical protein